MGRSSLLLAYAILAPVLFSLLFAACDESATGSPTLSAIGAQSLRVNEELRLTIGIDNPDGRPVSLSVEPPELPSFDRVHSLTSEPGGALFRWSPLSSHVGMQELTFVLTDAGGGTEYDRATVIFDVMPADDAAPVFVRPGAGGTYDLEREPCVTFDVEVRDDDSASVIIGYRTDLPAGATLANTGDKRATFDWCPTPDQVGSSERWTVQLFADDGDHPRVEHDYIVVLRSGPKDGCPGAAPVVAVDGPLMGEAVTSGTSYTVEVRVTDDMGLRDPPLLYYTVAAPADLTMPDVTTFEQATFEPADGDAYVARIPSLGLAEGAMTRVYYLVSATDNDDASGSTCDHRTDSALVSFFAVGGTPADGSLAQCDFCSSSSECASGICATTAGGGRCVDACSGDGVCAMGDCGATVTREGSTRAGCGPTSAVCGGGGGGTCTEDAREPDDSIAEATSYSSAITDGQICGGDADYFAISVGSGERVTAVVDGFVSTEGDLDLELRTASGAILDTSAGVGNSESAEHCNGGAASTVYARVFGYATDENGYDFSATVSPDPGGCCTVDAAEPDDTRTAARSVAFVPATGNGTATVEGTWCPGDDDWVAIPMTGPGRIEVTLLFDHALGDIDIALHDPSGTRIASSVGVTDEESIARDVAGGGTYALRIYGFGGGNDYYGEVTRSAGSTCTTTVDCPLDTVCNAGSCVNDICTSAGMCPSDHICASGGPIPAASHCSADCTSPFDCRVGEACKWAAEGRGCGRAGSRAAGDSCTSSASCGGERACVAWPGGYCARIGCASSADCEAGLHCVSEGGQNVCAVDCLWGGDDDCRAAAGYACTARMPVLGTFSEWVCLPD